MRHDTRGGGQARGSGCDTIVTVTGRVHVFEDLGHRFRRGTDICFEIRAIISVTDLHGTSPGVQGMALLLPCWG